MLLEKKLVLNDKLLIVSSFLELLNANQLSKIAELVSADFVFISPVRGRIDFAEYCKYVANISECFETKVRDNQVIDDQVIVYLDITIIDNSLNYFSEMKATATFEFDNQLLKSLSMKYKSTDQDVNYMKKFLSLR